MDGENSTVQAQICLVSKAYRRNSKKIVIGEKISVRIGWDNVKRAEVDIRAVLILAKMHLRG